MRYLPLCVLFATALTTGCTMIAQDVVVKYNHNTQPIPPTEAPVTGTYGLYYTADTTPTAKYPLKKGDRLGFIEREGKVYAIAGKFDPIPVQTTWSNRAVCWRQLEK